MSYLSYFPGLFKKSDPDDAIGGDEEQYYKLRDAWLLNEHLFNKWGKEGVSLANIIWIT